jgi:ketosteroid isomerase-like protein
MTVTTADTAVRDLIEEHAAAMRDMDADRLAACHRPGAVVYDLAPPLAKTFDREGMRSWFAEKGGGSMDYELRDLQVELAGDLAVGYGLVRMGDGATFELWFRTTLVLREVDGRWQIVHAHESTPFHMDGSLRAAVDLTP